MKVPRRRAYYELVFLLSFSLGIAIYYTLNARRKHAHIWLPAVQSNVDDEKLHDKWIVVTSVSSPSQDVAKLAEIDGWQLLVVGDTRTPDDWQYPGVVFLGVDKQRTLPYRTTDSIPYNSYTRKNIGYLYAIHHGAKFIYDTDDDNHPTSGRIEFHLQPSTTGLIYEDTKDDVMNPYSHFGQPTIWPRGYPLEAINAPTNITYTLCTLRTPAIQQGLVNKDPDVDAVFRMTRKKEPGVPFNITFDSRAPPFVLPEGVFAPFNSQNTLFTYEALWALFLPTSVSFRVTDIWRGYWAQRLMWLLGHKLAFFPPNAIQVRNPHDYLKDFKEEGEVYSESGHLISFLKQWACLQNVSFFACACQLSEDMAKANFWKEDDANLIAIWLTDLKSVGYREPSMAAIVDVRQPCDVEVGGIRTVFFSPVLRTELSQATSESAETGNVQMSGLVDLCDDFQNHSISETSLRKAAKIKSTNDNVLLIIVFNTPFHSVIPLLENLYHQQFPNIAYCGEVTTYNDAISKMKGTTFKVRWTQRPITFISIESKQGYFGYECAVRALEMNYVVDGYLVLGDDVLFNFWNFPKVDLNKAAYEKGVFHHNRYKRVNESAWNWWKTAMGYNATNWVLDELDSLLLQDKSAARRLLKKFFDNRNSKALNNSVSINLSDVYYLPRSKREMFLHVTNVFYKHRVFLEITVPTVLDGLHSTEIPSMSGKSVWGGDRNRWKDFYDDQEIYLHPVKLSEVLNNKDARKVYCQHYIQRFLNPNTRY